jgi:hypothetical protein
MAKRLKEPTEIVVADAVPVIPPDDNEMSESFVAVLHALSSGIDADPLTMLQTLGVEYYPYPLAHQPGQRVLYATKQAALKAVTKDLQEATEFLISCRKKDDEEGCLLDVNLGAKRLNRVANKITRMIDQIEETPANLVVVGMAVNDLIKVNQEIMVTAGRGPVTEQKNVKVSGRVQHTLSPGNQPQQSSYVSPSDAYSGHNGSTHDLGAIDAEFTEEMTD